MKHGQPEDFGLTERLSKLNVIFFDLETQKSAMEVGGWDKKHLMKMSVGVEEAADFLEDKGFPRELAIFALVGAMKAPRYGARPGLFWQRRGKPT